MTHVLARKDWLDSSSPLFEFRSWSWSALLLLALFAAASPYTSAASSSHRLKFRVENKFGVDPTPLSQPTQTL